VSDIACIREPRASRHEPSSSFSDTEFGARASSIISKIITSRGAVNQCNNTAAGDSFHNGSTPLCPFSQAAPACIVRGSSAGRAGSSGELLSICRNRRSLQTVCPHDQRVWHRGGFGEINERARAESGSMHAKSQSVNCVPPPV
jgi:hypothetical protein